MIKKIILLLLCMILCGCMETEDLEDKLPDAFASEKDELSIHRNNYTDYIDYYLPSDMQEYDCNEISHVFVFNRSKIIMDVNISGIINAKYYSDIVVNDEGFFDPDKLFFSRESSFRKNDETEHLYLCKIYSYEESYLLYFVCEDAIFYAYTNREDLLPLSSRILLIAKSLNVDNDDIIADFSFKDVIDYQKKQVNLFETIMPVNGNINEFLIGQDVNNDEGE